MNYSKIQKTTSFILIFSLLFSITFRVPFFDFLSTAKADDDNFYNLVSIIVDEDTYSKAGNKIDRYAKDIQGVLENTRAVILPVPTDVEAFDISSMNESLYFEGYKSLKNVSFESKLVGTVLVGDIPLPILSDNNKTTKSIVPYTDFEDKAYIYNHQSGYYEKNQELSDLLSPEIWHGVISPNSGSESIDIEQLEAFFDKSHDYYLGVGNFDSSKGIINGNLEEKNPAGYEPFVFYFDQFREEKAVYYPGYKGYAAYLDNKEDIVYNRYSKELAQKIKEEVLGAQNDEISSLIHSISDEKIKQAFEAQQELHLDNVSDISTRTITQESLNKFVEIFNGSALEDIRTNVHNAGRYNSGGSKVNVDFIPYLVSILDLMSDEVIKNVNNDLENKIDELVKNGLSRNIPIMESYSVEGMNEMICSEKYINFLHGRDASTINNASECTIYRGSTFNSGTLVEANRGLNIKNTEADFEDLNDLGIRYCSSMMGTEGYWGGNSPINLDLADSGNSSLKLGSHDLKSSVRPLYDILGSYKSDNAFNNPNPLNCFENNLILTNRTSQEFDSATCQISYNIPLGSSRPVSWTCDTDNIKMEYNKSFKDNYTYLDGYYGFSNCTIEKLNFLGETIKTSGLGSMLNDDCASYTTINYDYKPISSYIIHKSPTSSELYSQITNPITPNLPIDKNRYIDFVSARGNYAKINYPYLFRIGSLVKQSSENGSFDEQINNLESVLNNYLNIKSNEINGIIRLNNPLTQDGADSEIQSLLNNLENLLGDYINTGSEGLDFNNPLTQDGADLEIQSLLNNLENLLGDYVNTGDLNALTGVDLEIYNLLKTGVYPSANINFVQYLKNKPLKTIEINGEQKVINYFDYLVFSLYWSNLNSVSAKYKFIMEYYLSDQFGGNNFDYILPKNKKVYEIAYLGAPGDSQNMYIKLDPEAKGVNPYADIVSNNSLFDSNLLGVKALSKKTDGALFKCAPPDGVPIWEWIPAIMCRISDMLPPTIKISGGQCSGNFLNEIDSFNIQNYEKEHNCTNEDTNKNGINDCIESGLSGGEIELVSPTGSYGYNEIGDLKAVIKDSSGDKIIIDNETYVNLFLKELKTPDGEIIYDGGTLNESIIEQINKYIYFKENDIKTSFGEVNYNFSTKNKDADIVFGARLEKKDNKGNLIYNLESNDLAIEIRKENTSASHWGESNKLAGEASNIELNIGSSVLESGGSLSTNIITIYDSEGNIASGEYYELELSILGDSLEFENGKKSILYTTFEGFRAFRVRSTGESGNAKIRVKLIKNKENSLITSADIKVVSDVNLNIPLPSEQFKVGNNSYSLDIEVQDSSGNRLSDFNSRVYLNIPSKYGKTKQNYFEVINGVVSVEFETSYIAAKEIPFEFQIEGLNKIYKKYFTILPEKAMKIALKTSKSKLEASSTSYTYVEATLKDIYGNTVFNDNSTTLNIELQEKYRNILNLNEAQKITNQGEASFKINATELPGTAYLKVSSNPNLTNNTYEIQGQSPFPKEELTIDGFKEDGILSDLGKKFFYEVDSNNYRSLFNTIDDLKDSEFYNQLTSNQKFLLVSLWNNKNKFIIRGVGENAIKLDTYYFWSSEKIIDKKYNSIYSVLLGSSYGDFTQQDYLASGILFDKNNRGLAVTSLINNPYNYNDIVQLSSELSVKLVYNSSDLTQDIETNLLFTQNNIPYLDLFNNSLNTNIGKVFFNFSNNTNLQECTTSDCTKDLKQSSIFVKKSNSDYIINKSGDTLDFKNSLGNTIFSVNKNGNITKSSNATIQLDSSASSSKAIIFDIKISNTSIGKIGFYFNEGEIKVAKDDIALNGLLLSSPNSIIVRLASDDYGIRDVLSSDGKNIKTIYYNDPFNNEYSLNSFSEENMYSFENFAKQEGLGWKSGNKALLEFASGKNIGEAVKGYASVGIINLGDPVISLKKRERTLPGTDILRKFDRTIGKKINLSEISSYQVFDYNGDAKDDILLIGKDKYFKLLENKDVHGNFLNQRNLARVVDLGNESLILAGDFTGDSFEDIFFVNNKGKAFLLNNRQKDFIRIDLETQFDLNAKIIRAKVFDMDNDGIDDIVVLDDSGKIVIFYGGGTSASPQFSKNIVTSEYGISLNSQIRDDLGAVYFDGLSQLPADGDNSDLLSSSEEFNGNIDNILDDLISDDGNVGGLISPANEGLMDGYIYLRLPYNPGNIDDTSSQSELDNMISNLPKSNSPELDGSFDNLSGDIDSLIAYNYDDIEIDGSNSIVNTTFIRSQYSHLEGIKVEKVFNDENGANLKSGDKVSVDLILTNVGNKTIENIAYVEDVPDMFSIDMSSISNNKNGEIKNGNWGYKFLIDNFNLSPGESININYELETRSFSYGFIEVGLFEEGELGDDLFGDIIFKLDEKNCSQTVDIFRSISSKSYEKGEKEATCDSDKLELPTELQKNLLDADGNGVPDYIDELSNGDADSIKNYANEVEQDVYVDSDNDGIPDREDISPNYSGDNNSLLDFGLDVDEISEGIDNIINGLGCGFGGGSCISMPLNWAPLAPGSDPTVLGYPVGDGLKVGEGMPFSSSLTGLQTMCGTVPCCIPTVWPVSPLAYVPGPTCGTPSAGGRLGTWAPTNVARLFYTPTLTGAHGFAACYGGPAIVAGNSLPMGISPIIPGGNCVVTAFPMDFCSSEQNGDPMSLGTPSYFGDFGIINGNCDSKSDNKIVPNTTKLDESLVNDYLNYKNKGEQAPDFLDRLKEALSNPNGPSYGSSSSSSMFNRPLVSMDGGNDGMGSFSVDIDPTALKEGNFEDVIQVRNTRISSFPSFLMDWVNRQIEEIITKLTDFPTLFIILPDFTSVYNGDWGEYMKSGVQSSYDDGVDKQQKINSKADAQIASLESQKQALDCDTDYSVECSNLDLDILNANKDKGFGYGKEYSGIKEAYEFLSNTPLVSIEPEPVTLNIPWIDSTTLNKTIEDWKMTKERRNRELDDAKDSWTYGASCEEGDTQCEKENAIKEKFVIDVSSTIASLERNIKILEDYKKFPEKLSSLVNKKQDRLNQILCNLETISTITGGRIGKNGERFKAWVELYILIKAILKSWQLLADVFIEYDEQCHECKNERYDLLGFVFKLIDMIIPKIPVIQFPKWPDIVLDLHNIRLHLDIKIPDLNFNFRPVVLPTLPELNLPDSPSLTITLPAIPELPTIVLPELPDIPTLPTIELPNLPPPPKLPKLFGALEGILDILKLLTKIMCILKTSPFVPEWRAGDQIAYMTERSGYLSLDFLDISLPQFSFPFVDAIEVTTYVNLEFDVEFLVEMARALAIPLNSFTNNTVPLFDIKVNDIYLGEDLPQDIEIDLGGTSFKEDGKVDMTLKDFIKITALGINKLKDSIENNSKDELSSKQFLELINRELAKEKIASNPQLDDLREVWNQVNEMTYSNEDKLINDLIQVNSDKFEAVKTIINTEQIKTRELKEQIKSIEKPVFIDKISEYKENNFAAYNKSLDIYNKKFIDSASALIVGENKQAKEFKEMGELVLNKVKPVLNDYTSQASNNLISNTTSTTGGTSSGLNSCQQANNLDYKYNYEGLYVVETVEATGEKVSYNLFNYHDELNGKEELISIDFDGDNDTDLLYQMGTDLYIKENLNIKDDKFYVSENPLYVSSSNNKFVNQDTYYEAVNNFNETVVYAGAINMRFSASNRADVNNYRVEYYPIIDKYQNKNNAFYVPSGVKKSIIDAFSDSHNLGIIGENEVYKISKNLAHIYGAGENLAGVKLYTKKLHTINQDLNNNEFVNISRNTKIYTGNSKVKIFYLYGDETRTLDLDKNVNVEFDTPVKIYRIVGGEAYVTLEENSVITGSEILKYIGKPLVFGTKMEIVGDFYDSFDERSHIDIRYYDESEIGLDLRDLDRYEIYDLGYKDRDYLVSLNTENDYFYARTQVFKNNVLGTYSKQILLSPQLEADQNSPELNYTSKIRIPVYQEEIVDFTDYIYENTGIDNITNVSIDGIGDDEYEVLQSTGKIRVKFGKFDSIFTKEIEVKLVDKNNNESTRNIKLEVYSPIPKIDDYVDDSIQGKINENLIDEPISMYRIRGGSITRLKDANSSSTVSTKDLGDYNFAVNSGPSYVVFKKDSQELFRVDEQTGKIDFVSNPGDYNIDVVTSNVLDYPEIIVRDEQEEDIYYEKITLRGDLYIKEVTDFTSISENGIYIMMMNDNYSYYKLPEAINYNAGSYTIYRKTDVSKTPLFTIAKDGRVKTLNDYYKLEYTSFDDYVVFKMIDKHYNREVGRVMFRIENDFIIQ